MFLWSTHALAKIAHSGLADHLRATLLARPAIHRVMHAHFAELRERAEARASRSRVFSTERSRP